MLVYLFLKVVNMSITASFVILFVLITRLLLKKAPKIFSYVLWSVVLFRLVCPFSFESIYSLVPKINVETISDSGVLNHNFISDQTVNQITQANTNVVILNNSVSYLDLFLLVISVFWLIGFLCLLIYNIYSYINIYKQIKVSRKCVYKNVYINDKINTGFVLGVFKPCIYLPDNLNDEQFNYVLMHEQYHIKRKDHLTKLVSLLVLCIHWFNPLVWLSFNLSSQDMEMSCDEAVIKQMGIESKKDYSSLLLNMSLNNNQLKPSLLGFGNSDVKSRVKNILNYKKMSFKILMISIIILVIIGFGLVSNQRVVPITPSFSKDEIVNLINQEYNGEIFASEDYNDQYYFVAYYNENLVGYLAFEINEQQRYEKITENSVDSLNQFAHSSLYIDDYVLDIIFGLSDEKPTIFTRTIDSHLVENIEVMADEKLFLLMKRDYQSEVGLQYEISNDVMTSFSSYETPIKSIGLYNNQTDLNNVVKTEAIMNILEFPASVGYHKMEINEFNLSIYLNCSEQTKDYYTNNSLSQYFEDNVIVLFMLIDDVEQITLILDEDIKQTYTRQQFEDKFGEQYFKHADSLEVFKQNYDDVQAEIFNRKSQ